MSLVSFVIPTIGRQSLRKSLGSLAAQTDSDWTAIVVGDGIDPVRVQPDHRVSYYRAKLEKSPGTTRNFGISQLRGNVEESSWIGFLDDDDWLAPQYVQHLRHHDNDKNLDLVIFRLSSPRLGILPRVGDPKVALGHVGISFAVKAGFTFEHKLKFITNFEYGVVHEDYSFIHAAVGLGANHMISPFIDYMVGDDHGRS